MIVILSIYVLGFFFNLFILREREREREREHVHEQRRDRERERERERIPSRLYVVCTQLESNAGFHLMSHEIMT